MSLPDVISGQINSQPLNNNFSHLNDRLKNWKASVEAYADLPMEGNEQGDVRLVLNQRVLYFWDNGGWVPMEFELRWKDPVPTYHELPRNGETHGDARYVFDEQQIYIYDENVGESGDWVTKKWSAEEIKYESSANGINPENVKAALDLLSGSRVEMGENSNGVYVRWENGLQICFTPDENSLFLSFTSPGLLATTWNFPAPFIEQPFTVGSIRTTGDSSPGPDEILSVRFAASSNTSTAPRVSRISGGTNFQAGDYIEVYVLAIGRWK